MYVEIVALLHNIHIKIYERVALYRSQKLSEKKTKIEAGRNVLENQMKKRVGKNNTLNIFKH